MSTVSTYVDVEIDEWEIVDDLLSDYRNWIKRGTVTEGQWEALLELQKDIESLLEGCPNSPNVLPKPERWLDGMIMPEAPQ